MDNRALVQLPLPHVCEDCGQTANAERGIWFFITGVHHWYCDACHKERWLLHIKRGPYDGNKAKK